MARSLRPYGPGTARFSTCETWRYELTRDLSAQPFKRKRSGVLLSIGLNPSTATCDDDGIKFVGTLNEATGRFTPNVDGPNPVRKGSRNNIGDVWVVAKYTPEMVAGKPDRKRHV